MEREKSINEQSYTLSGIRLETNRTTEETDSLRPPYIHIEQYVEGTILLIICLVAIVGNISIWIIVIRTRPLRTITNSFMLVLCVFDLLVSFINMPVTVLTIFSGDWTFSDDICRIFGFANMVTLCGSVLSLCNISINRYIMVCMPLKFSKIYTKKRAALMIIASVIVTIGVSIPPLIGWCEYTYTPRQYICFANWPQSLSYALFMICCCFGIPLSVMIVCNYKIYQQVKLSRNKIKDAYTIRMSKGENYSTTISENISQSSINNSINEIVQHYKGDANAVTDNGDNRKPGSPIHIAVKPMENVELRRAGKTTPEEIRLARVLGIVVIVFFACWFPYCISMILSIVAPDAGHRIFYMATLLIGYFNSCCNPIIYGILNKRFTNGFKMLFCFCRR